MGGFDGFGCEVPVCLSTARMRLICVMSRSARRTFPSTDGRDRVAHIGLLVVHCAHRGRGIVSRLHAGVVAQAVGWGDVEVLRIGIVETNAAVAEPFGQVLCYRPTSGVAPHVSGKMRSSTAIWERALTPQGSG